MQMSRFSLAAASFLPLAVACAGFPFFRRAEEAGRPAAQAVLELQNGHYDGEYLSGRLLVGVAEGTLTLDKRLVENASVEVKSVWDCVTGQPVGFMEVDSFPEPASEDELLTLTPGYWYGAEVRFFLFDAKFTGRRPPACIEVELLLRAEEGSESGRVRVRAEQDVQQPPDAGIPGASRECDEPGDLEAGGSSKRCL